MPSQTILTPCRANFLPYSSNFLTRGDESLKIDLVRDIDIPFGEQLNRFPRMLKPIDLKTLQEFYLNLAQELMRGVKPA